jgi:hypothetical protein
MSIYIFYFIVLLELIIDATNSQTNMCMRRNLNATLLIILHHISNSFLLYGWIINNHIASALHIIVVLFTILHWRFNRNRCALTVKVNQQCGWDENKPFHDILDAIGLKRLPAWNEIWHYVFIAVGAGISMFRVKEILQSR